MKWSKPSLTDIVSNIRHPHRCNLKDDNLDKLSNNGQKLKVTIHGHCGMTIFDDANGDSYHFDGKLGKEVLPQTLIPIKFK